MKRKLFTTIFLLITFLASCAPGTAAPAPTATTLPSATPAPTITPTPTEMVTVGDLPQTKIAVDQFAMVMKTAGILLDSDQIRRHILINKMPGLNGQKIEIATTFLDPDPNQMGETLEGNFPLMIKVDGEEWKIISKIRWLSCNRQQKTQARSSPGLCRFPYPCYWRLLFLPVSPECINAR